MGHPVKRLGRAADGGCNTLIEIGYVMSGCSQSIVPFVVKEGHKAFINQYYFLPHPIRSARGEKGGYAEVVSVLARVFRVTPYNPEMSIGGFGPIAGKKGERAQYGKTLEYDIAWAEILGYVNERGKWYRLECSPGTWDPVFEPSEVEVRDFFSLLSSSGTSVDSLPYLLKVGRHRGLKVPVYLDLNALARGHMFISGMTRSGKSSFVINIVARSLELSPRPHFVILDRRSEYSVLTKYGAAVISYKSFLPRTGRFSGEALSSRLGLNPRTGPGKLVAEAIDVLASEGEEVTKASLAAKTREIAPLVLARDREGALARIQWAVRNKGAFLDEARERIDLVEAIRANEVLIIDFSVDTDIDEQHATTRNIIATIVDEAMRRRGNGDFAVVVVIEEAQYLAPEKGLKIEVGNPERIGVDRELVEAVSQAGGYNVGFLIVTQRPAYVSKSIISQCNSIACFRLMSGNDQEAIIRYSEYGNERLSDYLPGLADHEAMLWGMASPVPFPIIAEMDTREFPRKAGVTARQAWETMISRRQTALAVQTTR